MSSDPRKIQNSWLDLHDAMESALPQHIRAVVSGMLRHDACETGRAILRLLDDWYALNEEWRRGQ